MKWRTTCPELRLSGRPSPGAHVSPLFQNSGLRPEGFIALMPIPKGKGRRATYWPPGLRSWPAGRRSGRFPPLPYPPPRPSSSIPPRDRRYHDRPLGPPPSTISWKRKTISKARSLFGPIFSREILPRTRHGHFSPGPSPSPATTPRPTTPSPRSNPRNRPGRKCPWSRTHAHCSR